MSPSTWNFGSKWLTPFKNGDFLSIWPNLQRGFSATTELLVFFYFYSKFNKKLSYCRNSPRRRSLRRSWSCSVNFDTNPKQSTEWITLTYHAVPVAQHFSNCRLWQRVPLVKALVLGNFLNVAINQVDPKTRFFVLHFRCRQCGWSNVNLQFEVLKAKYWRFKS